MSLLTLGASLIADQVWEAPNAASSVNFTHKLFAAAAVLLFRVLIPIFKVRFEFPYVLYQA